MYDKTIIYDAETRDFAMYLDGELVGFARTYREAEESLDALVYDLLARGYADEQPAAAEPEPAPAPAVRGSSIAADVEGLEIYGHVMLSRPHAGGVRRVWYGTPDCCVSVCNVTGRTVYSNAITGERIGGLSRLIAHAEQVGRREFAWLNPTAA